MAAGLPSTLVSNPVNTLADTANGNISLQLTSTGISLNGSGTTQNLVLLDSSIALGTTTFTLDSFNFNFTDSVLSNQSLTLSTNRFELFRDQSANRFVSDQLATTGSLVLVTGIYSFNVAAFTGVVTNQYLVCLLYTSPSPRD